MYPLQVEINEKNILKLQKTFKRAQAAIEREIFNATDFGVANRQNILSQIDAIVDDLAIKVDGFVQKELPLYYDRGLEDADKQLKNVGAELGLSEKFNLVHQDAILALVDDTARAFAESMTGVKRSARTVLGKAVREEITQAIAKGLIGGEATRSVKGAIKELVREQGISALVDKGGKKWTLDRYSEMLFRTKAVEARNRGLANRMVEFNYDLVQVSNHNSEHRECAYWEGRILSVTGQTKGYPTVAQAEAGGLFHPNCKHAINALIPSLARQTEAYNPDERTKVIGKAEIEKATKLERENLPK